MTAYEEYKFNQADEVVAVIPALPQNVWAEQVFAFTEVLRQELDRANNASTRTIEELGQPYVDGCYDTAEQLRTRFYEIFKVSEVPAI